MKVNVTRKPLIGAVLLLTSLGVTTSCIDKSYDLDKDIDMTINVGGQYLAFPVGSTEKVTLDKIIEIEKGDDLQLLNGDYHLIRKDDIAETTTQVALASMDPTTIPITPIEVINGNGIGRSIDFTTGLITVSGGTTISIADIDASVAEIGSITAERPVNLTVNLQPTGNVVYNAAYLKELKITFPKYLKFQDGITGMTDNTYTISNKQIDKTNGLQIKLPVTGFFFGAEYGKGKKIKNGSFQLDADIELATVILIEGLVANAQPTFKLTPIVTLPAMNLNSITGTMKPKIEVDPTDITLSNLPEFLEDDEVTLDITNPIISFKANNPLQADIELDGILTAYKNGNVTGTVKIGSVNGEKAIVLKPSGMEQQTITLTRKAINVEGVTNVVVPNLNNLIETIPDRITVELTPAIKSNDYFTVELGKDYALKSSYEIDIPLSFGSGMQIVYKDSIDGLNSDLEDIEFKKAAIAMTVDNGIPLKLEIKDENVVLKDAKGQKMDGVKISVTGVIAESKDGVAATTSQLAIAIEETKEGAISQMDVIEFKVTAVPGQATDVQLRSNQWVQFKDIKLRVPNGIKVDLN